VQGLAVQVARVTKMLGDEFGTASNIKNRVNRQSVLGAITSAQQRLKLYNRVPPVRVPLSPPVCFQMLLTRQSWVIHTRLGSLQLLQ
jgi:peptide subunit release factor 1 (eRF1)